jgi:hypothetical protein
MSNKKRKAKIRRLGHMLDYLEVKIARHAKVLEIHRTELAAVDAAVKGMVKLLNANKETK